MANTREYSPCTRKKKTLLEKLQFFLQRKCTIGFLQSIFAQKKLSRACGILTVHKAFFVIVIGLIISLGAPSSIKANPGVHINVPQSPLSPGQPVYIEFWTDVGEDGTLQMDITKPPLLAIFWQSGPIQVTGGLLYNVTAPGFNDPGTYTVSASVNLAGGGGTIHGSTTFEVVGGGSGPGGGGPGFDFNLEADPPAQEVEQGETARYQMHVMYSDPSYGGTPINVNVTGLGHEMQWYTTPGGELIIETSPETPPGDYQIEIIGEAQGVERRTHVTLIVRERPEHEEHEEPPEHEEHEEPPEHEEHEEPPEHEEHEEPPEEHEEHEEPHEEPPEHEEEDRPSQPQNTWQPQSGGSTMEDLFSNPLLLVIIVLLVIIILLIIAVMRK